MFRSLLLGALCLIYSAVAQQYISAGPVPQRPNAFAGATFADQPATRPVIRQRPIGRALQQEPVFSRAAPSPNTVPQGQPIRLRRPQVARARNNYVDEDISEGTAKQRIGIGNSDDVYLKQRVQTPAPPTLPPIPQTTRVLAPRPVAPVEEEYVEEEEDDTTTPASISRSSYVGQFQPSQSPTPFQRPAFLQPTSFRPAPVSPIQQYPALPAPLAPAVRQFPRPQPQLRPIPQAIATPITRPPPPLQQTSEEEEEEEELQYQRQPVRQQIKRPEPDSRPNPVARPAPQPIRQQSTVRQQEVYRPHPSKPSTQVQREKKPVAQTLRKYQTENEDGSITWGYENDDGSFKEETIGNDCVTRGKYGYFDPDGVKREYSYQTGIPCDKEAEAEQAASANEGYIDYSSNKYVFPNGDEIDLEAMVKNKKRKPVGKYRN